MTTIVNTMLQIQMQDSKWSYFVHLQLTGCRLPMLGQSLVCDRRGAKCQPGSRWPTFGGIVTLFVDRKTSSISNKQESNNSSVTNSTRVVYRSLAVPWRYRPWSPSPLSWSHRRCPHCWFGAVAIVPLLRCRSASRLSIIVAPTCSLSFNNTICV